jgi:hypothetical protein
MLGLTWAIFKNVAAPDVFIQEMNGKLPGSIF